MRALLLLVLGSCWRGAGTEPVETAPAPVSAKRTGRAPIMGPSLSSFSPGPLAIVHAAWDQPDGCLTCHLSVGTQAPLGNDRCISCHDHEDIRTQKATGKGLHAHLRNLCQSCHREHKGRGFDLRGWNAFPGGEAGFDHVLAGWAMPPQYVGMPCSGCHGTVDSQGLRVYRGLDRAQFP